MSKKRSHGAFEATQKGDVVAKPAAGTKTFTSGTAVRDALASGSRQAFVAFHQQIITPLSSLPLAITDAPIVILQHYHQASPNFDEVFNAWSQGDKARNERQVEASVALLVHIIQLLTPIPFFRTAVLNIVTKIVSFNEPYADLINRMIQSGRRDHVLLGLQLAAAAVHTDVPDPTAGPSHGSSGRMAVKTWSALVEGGSAKVLGKVLGMRRRNKEGTVGYGSKDPLDRPDIRHAALHLITPLFSLSTFHAHTKTILPGIYNNLKDDPAITIYRVLTALWAAITGPSSGVGRRTAIALLNENAIESLLALLIREDVDIISQRTVSDVVFGFLEGVTAVPGQGICFPDQGWYPRNSEGEKKPSKSKGEEEAANGPDHEGRLRKGLHNRILSNVVRRVGSKVVDDQGKVGEWVIKVLNACPELVAGYWPHSALSLEPRLNPRWLATISYVGRIISLPTPPLATVYEPIPRGSDLQTMPPRPNPPSVANMIESIFPSPLGKVHLSKGLQHTDHLVQHVTALTLARGLQKLNVVQGILRKVESEIDAEPRSSGSSENAWTKRALELEVECRRRVPDILVVIGFAQKSATLARISPENEDEEPDPKLVARSAMLTEVALRLFGLYHTTLPAISREAKFDVGKLLVSASSAKAERREKREAREGSVVSDGGSVASVGTVGTVGMGGGFGQSRGDVDGFEAMSQVHVLSLLTRVQDWNWTSKAAGSQYSYLYHILILHLSTPHPITHRMTTLLLRKLLVPSILFEHDHGELEIWLSALPVLSSATDVSQRIWFVAQQIHLLSFIDECARRCMKTPYRYIEDTVSLVPGYFRPNIRPDELVSPLLMTMLEQLRAKILGQHIATEAAGIVLAYLRRVILSFSGKMRDGMFLQVVLEKIEAGVVEARGKGQERKGLLGSVQEMQEELREVFGGDKVSVTEDGAVKMIDEEQWATTCFERSILDNDIEKAERLVDCASDSAIERYGRFAVHLLSNSKTDIALKIIRDALAKSQGIHATRLRRTVFEAPAVETRLLPGSSADAGILADIVQSLRISDGPLATEYVHKLIEALRGDRKGKNYESIFDKIFLWTRFFSPNEAKDAIVIVLQHSKRLRDLSERSKSALSSLLVASADPAFALGKLGELIPLGIVSPFSELVKVTADKSPKIEVDVQAVEQIVAVDTPEADNLLGSLLEVSPSAVRSTARVFATNRKLLEKPGLLRSVAILLEIPNLLEKETFPTIVKTAVDVLASTEDDNQPSARRVLVGLIKDGTGLVDQAVQQLTLSSFGPGLATFTRDIATFPAVGSAFQHLVHLGLQHVTRASSSDAVFDEKILATINDLCSAVQAATRLDLNADHVEPVVTSVIQERLEVSEVTCFAAVLVEQCMLKASFIRQHLSLLFSSSTYKALALPNATVPCRSSFIHLLSALFTANSYISCQPNFVEQLLPLYRGTLSLADQRVLALFHLFEGYRHVSVSSILSAWSAGAGTSSRAFDAITSVEPGRVIATSISFPMRRPVRSIHPVDHNADGEELYDPAFILPLFVAALRDGLTGLDWVEILRTNVVGLAVSSLSSREADMRALGGYILAKSMASLESVAFQEKAQLVYTLRLIRHAIPPPLTTTSQNFARLPVITTTFLAHALRTFASPSNPLYPEVSRFLLQRPTFDAGDVPMLFGMLYAHGEGYRRDRAWIVRLIRDATRSNADWRLLKRRKTVELLQTLFQSSVDPTFRRLVLQALESITRITPAALSLVHRGSLISWLNSMWTKDEVGSARGSEEEQGRILGILENLVIVLVSKTKVDGGGVKDGEEVNGKPAGAAVASPRQEWVASTERLLSRAARTASMDRLRVITRISLRLSALSSFSASVGLFLPTLVDRLMALQPAPVSQGPANTAVVQDLFRISLTVSDVPSSSLVKSLQEISRRVRRLDGPVGEWVRRETRLASWQSQVDVAE